MNEITLIKSILTYSIDNYDHENNDYLQLLGINAESFFRSKIYKKRIKKEEEIKEAIEAPSGVIKIIGKAGTGKTTVATKVLRSFGKEYFTERIDVKKLTGIENSKLKSGDELTNFLDSILMPIFVEKMSQKEISEDDVLIYYLNSTGKIREHISRNAQYIKQESEVRKAFLRQRRRGKSSDCVSEWINSIELDQPEYTLVQALFNALLPEDVVYYLKNSLKEFSSCIIYFDNVDSIIDDGVRLAFFNIMDKYQAKKSDCMTIMMSYRSNNPSLLERTDYGSFNDQAINMDVIDDRNHDPDDLIEDENNILIKNNSQLELKQNEEEEDDELDVSGLTQKQIYYLKRKYNSRKNERFALQLIYRRINHILVNKNDIIRHCNFERVNEIATLILSFLRDKHLSLTTATIGNFDRRETLNIISKFIKHFYDNGLNRRVDSIKSRRQKMTFYESHYYQWLGSKTSVLPKNLKNVLIELKYWKKNQNKHSGCLFDLQLLNFILNNTDPSDETIKDARRLVVQDIYEVFENIDIRSSVVRKGIFRLFKQDGKHLGLFEMSRYYGILSPEDIDPTDEIWLTPRGESYIMYINLKYSYIYSLINSNNNIDDNPISKNAFQRMYETLYEIGVMYLYGLQNLKSKLNYSFPDRPKVFWMKYYSDKFTINTPATEKVETELKYGNLHFANLLTSHMKYLTLISIRESNSVNYNIIQKAYGDYFRLLSRFDDIVDSIVNERVRTERNFRIELSGN